MNNCIWKIIRPRRQSSWISALRGVAMAAAEDPKAAQETVVDVILAQADALERLIKRKSAFREEEFEDMREKMLTSFDERRKVAEVWEKHQRDVAVRSMEEAARAEKRQRKAATEPGHLGHSSAPAKLRDDTWNEVNFPDVIREFATFEEGQAAVKEAFEHGLGYGQPLVPIGLSVVRPSGIGGNKIRKWLDQAGHRLGLFLSFRNSKTVDPNGHSVLKANAGQGEFIFYDAEAPAAAAPAAVASVAGDAAPTAVAGGAESQACISVYHCCICRSYVVSVCRISVSVLVSVPEHVFVSVSVYVYIIWDVLCNMVSLQVTAGDTPPHAYAQFATLEGEPLQPQSQVDDVRGGDVDGSGGGPTAPADSAESHAAEDDVEEAGGDDAGAGGDGGSPTAAAGGAASQEADALDEDSETRSHDMEGAERAEPYDEAAAKKGSPAAGESDDLQLESSMKVRIRACMYYVCIMYVCSCLFHCSICCLYCCI